MEGRKVRSAMVSESPTDYSRRLDEIAKASEDVVRETETMSEKRSRSRGRES